MPTSLSSWIVFTGGVLVLLLLDLVVVRRGREELSTREALLTTMGWIGISALFGLWIWHRGGPARGLDFFTGYVIEYALSLDNIFIFVVVFPSFQVAPAQQRRLLFWGVLGAMIMRGLMVGAGTALLARFAWVTYLFGAYIIYAGLTLLRPKVDEKMEDKLIVRLARRLLPLSTAAVPTGFFTREKGRLKLTVLALVLLVVEFTDLVFALDSVPAVFGVTHDPFIVYTSNICAILGLRSLYFLLAGAMHHLGYLHYGLAGVLIFIGAKMMTEHVFPISTGLSLVVVASILALAVGASFITPKSTSHAST